MIPSRLPLDLVIGLLFVVVSGIPTRGLGYAGTVDHRCGGPGDVACGVGRLIDEDHHQAQEGEVGSNGHCLE